MQMEISHLSLRISRQRHLAILIHASSLEAGDNEPGMERVEGRFVVSVCIPAGGYPFEENGKRKTKVWITDTGEENAVHQQLLAEAFFFPPSHYDKHVETNSGADAATTT